MIQNIMEKLALQKRTKIVATIGPATEDEKTMTALARAGMDVIRLNFSHGDFEEHGKRIVNARKVSKKIGRPIAILQDLAGPKIRIGEFYKERVMLKKGSTFTLTTKKIVGDETKAFVNYARLPREVKKGGTILLDDGKKKLEVLRTTKTDIICKVIVGGETKGKRGVNVPGAHLNISSITEKDKKDLAFGMSHKVDFVALSFVRSPKDVKDLRALLLKHKSQAGIISKIETQEAIENIDEIITLSDGIMVARGDLAIEVPAQDVPIHQKMIIEKCNAAGKPVITATQMLESMIKSPVPTRAEVSDVANSILDGTDAVMLSEETTLGDYPVEAVMVMAKVAETAEARWGDFHFRSKWRKEYTHTVVDSVSRAVVRTAEETEAKAIVALTESGGTARMIARFHPRQIVFVMTSREHVARKMALSFGCIPMPTKDFAHIDHATEVIDAFMKKNGIAKQGERVVVAAGLPFGKTGGTNMVLVHTV
ncbi:MAG: pyruvate kinase [Patescibacteria group bacterium]